MDARTVARLVAYGRIAAGAALVVAPELVASRWVGDAARSPGGRVLSVTFGARDLVIGAGTAHALGGGGAARPWLLASALTDGVDAIATLAARRSLPSAGAAGTIALAAGAAAVGLWTARELPGQPVP